MGFLLDFFDQLATHLDLCQPRVPAVHAVGMRRKCHSCARYAVVDAGDARNDPFDTNMLDSDSVEGDAFGDAMLRQWLIENLTP